MRRNRAMKAVKALLTLILVYGLQSRTQTLIAQTQPNFYSPGYLLQHTNTFDGGAALGDFDGDNDLDLVITRATLSNPLETNRVYFNDGQGNFTWDNVTWGTANNNSVALSDVDADGDLDFFVTGVNPPYASYIRFNNGSGTFTWNNVIIAPSWRAIDVEMGDLDGDGDEDAWVTANGPNTIWKNNGNGIYTQHQSTPGRETWDVALGDFDGDNDLDAFTANANNDRNYIWFNNGSGTFTQGAQAFTFQASTAVETGDIDNDGDLDLIVGNFNINSEVWKNNGNGTFTQQSPLLPIQQVRVIKLADFDNDGDLDAYIGGTADTIYINDGTGNFTAGQGLTTQFARDAAVGDIDADGDQDMVILSMDGTRIFYNQANSNNSCAGYDFEWQPSSTCPGDSLTYRIPFPLNGATASWDFGDGTTTNTTDSTIRHAYTAAGTYTVQLTVTNPGCPPAVTTHDVTIAGITLNAGLTHPSTVGGTNGQIDLQVGGGQSPYTYNWTNGSTSEDLTNISAGTYTVTVTDANGCSSTESFTLNDPLQLNACLDDTLTFIPNDTNSSRTYSWNFGDGTTSSQMIATHSYSSTGSYTVSLTVLDTNGCTSTTWYTINIGNLNITALTTTDVACFGDTTGAASVTVTGGATPYIYSWSNGATTQTVNGLSAGTYSVTITDQNGCSKDTTITITQPATAVAATATGTNATCFGSLDGTATVTPTGGTPGYTYSWSTGQNTQTATGLAAGTYTVTVTDANGCTATTTVTITEPAPIVITLVATESCTNDNSGSVTSTVSGGTGPYTYLWNTGATTANLTNVGPGTYTVRVTDANGCSRTISITLTGLLSPNSGFIIQR